MLREFERQGIDAVVAPGMPFPAVPSGRAEKLQAGISYTAVYNMLNFPAGSVPVRTFKHSHIRI